MVAAARLVVEAATWQKRNFGGSCSVLGSAAAVQELLPDGRYLHVYALEDKSSNGFVGKRY